jgi:cation diffusion facilitator family transporter
MHKRDRRVVLAAFAANLGIASAKFVGFLVTGAASLAAEAIHSLADTTNQGLLLLGAARARRQPTPDHPFGYGGERYFWSFVVAVVLFTGGGLFALFEAEEKLRHPHEVTSLPWAIGILLVAVALESASLRTALGRAKGTKGRESWFGFIRQSKRAELPVVLLEDSGALLGLAFALTGVMLAALTGNARFDAMGSLAIGLLLVTIALTLAAEMKSLLIGESASDENVCAIRAAIVAEDSVTSVADLRTLHLAPDRLLVTTRVSFVSSLKGIELVAAAARIERSIAHATPLDTLVFVHPSIQEAQ